MSAPCNPELAKSLPSKHFCTPSNGDGLLQQTPSNLSGDSMKAGLRVSVVIPAFNYGRYLRGAIDSVLAQEGVELEVIVVDDGSTDDSAQIVSTYTDPRVRYVYQTNSGLSAARNTGIQQARAPFIAFLDADDVWLPSMLSTAMHRFTTLPDGVGLVACNSIRVDETERPIGEKRYEPPVDRYFTAQDIVLLNHFMPSTVVARREAFDSCGVFDTSLNSSEDRDMWIRIGMRYRIYRSGASLVLIRKHQHNMSKNSRRMRLNMKRVIRKAYHARVAGPGNFAFWLRVYSIYYFQNAWMQFDEGRSWNAVRDVATSLMIWPFFHIRRDLNEPLLFRIRSLGRFLVAGVLPEKVDRTS